MATRATLQAERAKALPALRKCLVLALKAPAKGTSHPVIVQQLRSLQLALEDFYTPAGLRDLLSLHLTESEMDLYSQEQLPVSLTSMLDRLGALLPAEYAGASLDFWELAGGVWSLAAILLWALSSTASTSGRRFTQAIEQIKTARLSNVEGENMSAGRAVLASPALCVYNHCKTTCSCSCY